METSSFDLKQSAARADGNHYYGDGGTIHGSTELNVEIDGKTGEVTAVWFRCLNLPFKVWSRGSDPARINPEGMQIRGIEYRDSAS